MDHRSLPVQEGGEGAPRGGQIGENTLFDDAPGVHHLDPSGAGVGEGDVGKTDGEGGIVQVRRAARARVQN